MKKLLFVLAATTIMAFIACKSKPATVTGEQLMPDMKKTDSVEVLFFKEPEIQRWYTYLPSTDKQFIRSLVDNVSGAVGDSTNCPKDGKIYCFKNGEIFNTVYFGFSDEKCSFIRFIKEGKVYSFSLNENLKKQLTSYKALAKEPVAQDSVQQQ